MIQRFRDVGLPIGLALCWIILFSASTAWGQPAPPTHVEAVDTPNDTGNSITVRWQISPDDKAGAGVDGKMNVVGYHILRSDDPAGPFQLLQEVAGGITEFRDDDGMAGSPAYYYRVRAVDGAGETADSETVGPVKATSEWFHTGKVYILIAVLLYSAILVYCIYHARRGREFFVRRIAGLEAVDEAIGRATEMGRPILYTLGLGGISNIATIASLNILGEVAKRTAEYETPLRVPCYDPIVMNVVREVVRSSYSDAGRPDAYSEDNVFFITDSQFAYAAAVDGIMIREKPAAIFYQGHFYAESLILAETGNSVGAIQIAGTDSDAQLPFFITACDYTLIGEELFAASAYLSREPLIMGSLKGQDYGKALVLAALLVGTVLEIFGVHWVSTFFQAAS